MAKKNPQEDNEKKVDMKYNFSVYLSFLKKYRWMFVFTLFFVLIGELKQVIDKYMFKVIIDKGTGFMAGTISSGILASDLSIVAIVFISASIINVFANWIRIHLLNILDADMIFDLKQRFFGHIVGLDHKFHTTHKTGSLIARLTRGGSAMERVNDSLIFEFAPLILQLTVVSIALIYLDWLSAVIITSTFVVFIAYSLFMQKKIANSNVLSNKAEDIEKGNISDIFTNIDSVRYFGKEEYIKTKYRNLSSDTKKKTLTSWGYWRWVSAGQGIILATGTFLLVYFSITKMISGQISLGTLTFIYTTFIGLFGPLWSFVNGVRNMSRAMADFQDLFEYGKFENEIKDKTNNELKIKDGAINFKKVSFKYGSRNMFSDFNLVVPANKKVALVGHSGCGKTTLVKLLYRLYDVDSGEILIDGKNISDFKQESLRSEMSVVPQEAVLFDDTIYNNVSFSNPKASRKEVLAAMKFAQLDKIIMNFPNKEETIVGERGVKLSGGEKQRVSIARAILANKKVLLLDEATSALDSETEHEIQKDLEQLMHGRTSIIIAHRLSTIMNADKIVVMHNGKIVQEGTHRQLISQEGQYKKLWNLQKGGYIK